MYRTQNDEFEGWLEGQMAGEAEEHIQKLDQRMASTFEPQIERKREGFFGRTPALRLALSHAVIALLFFGVGFYTQLGGDGLRMTSSNESEEVASESAPAAASEMRFDTSLNDKQQAISAYGNLQRIDEDQIPEELRLVEDFAAIPVTGLNLQRGDFNISGGADDASSSAAAADSADAAPAASEMAQTDQDQAADGLSVGRLMNLLNQNAIQQDGYLYALTADSLLRLDLSMAEILVGNLQAPAGWSFDERGNIFVVDTAGDENIYYRIEPIEPPEESDLE